MLSWPRDTCAGNYHCLKRGTNCNTSTSTSTNTNTNTYTNTNLNTNTNTNTNINANTNTNTNTNTSNHLEWTLLSEEVFVGKCRGPSCSVVVLKIT